MCGLWDVPRNKIAVKIFIMIIFAYSAMKKRANGPAAYSTLKPRLALILLQLNQMELGLFLLVLR